MLLTVILVGFVAFSNAAPRSKSKGPQLVYDQKQHGDYNIQVHLKDFQIIALLGEESLGGIGDYDYNYDYADFTVKPSSSKPTQDISTSTYKPPLEAEFTSTKLSTTLKPSDAETNNSVSSTEKPLSSLEEVKPEEQKPEEQKPSSDSPTKDQPSSTGKPEGTTKESLGSPAAYDIPGQIQVQVIQSLRDLHNLNEKKEQSGDKDFAVKASDRKCTTGFTKDKRGRCRRVRKPQSPLPFNFGRLVNLAKRFRSNDEDDSVETPTSANFLPQPHQN
ncbi:uncharacterized protein LOC123680541 isoform X2 [Harmonia axyridis]|uniref:uncharacterized protein LOC123680541 isoform X2 n=1 Tax=Harmonia axyridis TaxID=115357 RepID=UPI001E275A0A|nr:uncharacterized protein LOC123680541 isoform X2 [Harmonia axyridis]